MLQFFRKYQKYFFLLTTIVIVVSFSFFGTFSTLSQSQVIEPVAFTAIDGTKVMRSEVDKMVQFISTDAEDKLMYGAAWGPNFLNDGVVKKEFLETGIAASLIAAYQDQLGDELVRKHAKEKNWQLYQHPQAPFISTEGAWAYFSPVMKSSYDQLVQSSDPTSQTALDARVHAFLEQRRLPPGMLKQVLRYQERQYEWLKPDPNLDTTDLSAFGYHTLDDWFGPKFIRLVAEFIINNAIIAEQRGYTVSKEEALADLMRNSTLSYQQNQRNPNIGVASSNEYFNEQLRRLGLDQNSAVKIWQKVLLFKRFYNDMGNSVLVDRLSFDQFNTYAKEIAEGEIYRLPKALQLKDFNALQKLEAYINAVAVKEDRSSAQLPRNFLPAAQVAKKAPELVEKRFTLDISTVTNDDLQTRVSQRDAWAWENNEQNFILIKKEFPELASKPSATRAERQSLLDALDARTRARLDRFARQQVVLAHPEWLQEALKNAPAQRIETGIARKGDSQLIKGLKDNKGLIALLDKAPLNGVDEGASDEQKAAQQQLDAYSANNNNYYKIIVVQKPEGDTLLTFDEANSKGLLDKMLTRMLMAHYTSTREKDPAKFQGEDKVWKPFNDIRDAVAEDYFAKALKNARNDIKAADNSINADKLSLQQLANMRLLPHVQMVKTLVQNQAGNLQQWLDTTAEEKIFTTVDETAAAPSSNQYLADQWKMSRSAYRVDRGSAKGSMDNEQPFSIAIGVWSKLATPTNGDIAFFQINTRSFDQTVESAAEQTYAAQMLVGFAAKHALANDIITLLKDKNAISLDYLKTPLEAGFDGSIEQPLES